MQSRPRATAYCRPNRRRSPGRAARWNAIRDLEVLASDSQTRVFTVRTRHWSSRDLNLNEWPPPCATERRSDGAGRAARRHRRRSGAAPNPRLPVADRQRLHPTRGASARAERSLSYTIERTGGQLRVCGPGVSIVSSGAKVGSNQPGAGRAPRADHLRGQAHAEARRSQHLRRGRRDHRARRLRAVHHQQPHRRLGHRPDRRRRHRARREQPDRRRSTARSTPPIAPRCTCAPPPSRACRGGPSSRACWIRAAIKWR